MVPDSALYSKVHENTATCRGQRHVTQIRQLDAGTHVRISEGSQLGGAYAGDCCAERLGLHWFGDIVGNPCSHLLSPVNTACVFLIAFSLRSYVFHQYFIILAQKRARRQIPNSTQRGK